MNNANDLVGTIYFGMVIAFIVIMMLRFRRQQKQWDKQMRERWDRINGLTQGRLGSYDEWRRRNDG
jgi:preprotein translocase subunit YajC